MYANTKELGSSTSGPLSLLLEQTRGESFEFGELGASKSWELNL